MSKTKHVCTAHLIQKQMARPGVFFTREREREEGLGVGRGGGGGVGRGGCREMGGLEAGVGQRYKSSVSGRSR